MSETDIKTTHLKASDPSTWKKGEDETWGNKFLHPNRPLSERHRELARMIAHGKRNKDIMEILGYTSARISVLRSNQKIMDEVEHYKDKLFGVDAQTRLKELSGDALNVMTSILQSSTIADEDKESAAKWVLEKITGKPAQQVDVRSEVSVGIFLDKLDKIKLTGAPMALPENETEIIDIIPKDGEEPEAETAKKPASKGFADWLDTNF